MWGGHNLGRAMSAVQMMLGRHTTTTSISALRVLHLFLQRIGAAAHMVRRAPRACTLAAPNLLDPPACCVAAPNLLNPPAAPAPVTATPPPADAATFGLDLAGSMFCAWHNPCRIGLRLAAPCLLFLA